jgi:sulfate transporter 4
MGTLSIIALLGLKTVGKKYPKYNWVRAAGPLTVTALTILFTWVFDLESKGIPTVGNIPKGFPSYTANLWTPIEQPGKVLTVTIGIVVVGFMESIAIAKQLASKHKYELDSSLELVGLGMSNFMGSMFQSFPVTGSFSRSAVNNDSGAQSGISGIVTATIVAMVLLFLTPVFEKMVSLRIKG